MLCQECTKRHLCQSECPELSLHLKEIEKPQREITFGFLGNPRKIPWASSNPVNLTKREQEILMLLGQGLSRRDVSEMLDITLNSVRVHLFNVKGKY